MKKESTHRTIKLDADVANIAAELASKRKLSSVLSELLRREYGITFEEDLIQSQVNELNRQREGIEKALNDLHQIQHQKEIEINKQSRIDQLEREFSLLKLNMDQEIEAIRSRPLESFNISTIGLEAWEITKHLAKQRGDMRIEITKKYDNRRKEIAGELKRLRE